MHPLITKKDHVHYLYEFLNEFPMLEGKSLFIYNHSNPSDPNYTITANLLALRMELQQYNQNENIMDASQLLTEDA